MLRIFKIIPYQTTTGNYNNLLSRTFVFTLYHTKQQPGTTTRSLQEVDSIPLYHTKQQPGTTTNLFLVLHNLLLYHTKQQPGTTTASCQL